MSALTDYFTSLANKIRSKTGGSGSLTPTQMVSAVDDVYSAGQAHPVTQEKTADAYQSYESVKTILPDSGKYLSKVNIPKFLSGSFDGFNPMTATYVGMTAYKITNVPSTGLYLLVLPGGGSLMDRTNVTPVKSDITYSLNRTESGSITEVARTDVLLVAITVASNNMLVIEHTPKWNDTTIKIGLIKLADL